MAYFLNKTQGICLINLISTSHFANIIVFWKKRVEPVGLSFGMTALFILEES